MLLLLFRCFIVVLDRDHLIEIVRKLESTKQVDKAYINGVLADVDDLLKHSANVSVGTTNTFNKKRTKQYNEKWFNDDY